MQTLGRPVRRGQIWWMNWDPGRGSEQFGRRPSIIIQSNMANELEDYGLTIVIPMTSSPLLESPARILVHPSKLNGLTKSGVIKCEQVHTASKSRLDGYIGILEPGLMAKVDTALKKVLGLGS